MWEFKDTQDDSKTLLVKEENETNFTRLQPKKQGGVLDIEYVTAIVF